MTATTFPTTLFTVTIQTESVPAPAPEPKSASPADVAGIFPFLSTVVWVVLIGWIFWTLRANLKKLIDRIKGFKGGGVEVDCGANSLPAETADKLQEIAAVEIREELPYWEGKILNTLFTKQVNKYPDYNNVWSFWIGPFDVQYERYAEAKGKLLSKGLIYETNDENRSIFITRKGYKYCIQHYKQLPYEQWWPEEQINKDTLQKVLNGEVGPNKITSGSGFD